MRLPKSIHMRFFEKFILYSLKLEKFKKKKIYLKINRRFRENDFLKTIKITNRII